MAWMVAVTVEVAAAKAAKEAYARMREFARRILTNARCECQHDICVCVLDEDSVLTSTDCPVVRVEEGGRIVKAVQLACSWSRSMSGKVETQ